MAQIPSLNCSNDLQTACYVQTAEQRWLFVDKDSKIVPLVTRSVPRRCVVTVRYRKKKQNEEKQTDGQRGNFA